MIFLELKSGDQPTNLLEQMLLFSNYIKRMIMFIILLEMSKHIRLNTAKQHEVFELHHQGKDFTTVWSFNESSSSSFE